MDEIFQQWSIYRKVIDNDYLEHNQIAAILETELLACKNFQDLLDLGCGDAEVFHRLSARFSAVRYVGVDVTPSALDCARGRLQGHGASCKFYGMDLLGFLKESPDRYDVILVGFALHHLSAEDKQLFLRLARCRLAPGGRLIIYDTFRTIGQTRQQYLDTYFQNVAKKWTSLDEQEMSLLYEHVSNKDFPETIASMESWAIQANFSRVAQIWQGNWPGYGMLSCHTG